MSMNPFGMLGRIANPTEQKFDQIVEKEDEV